VTLLHVIAPYCNPMGWRTRLANFRRFEDAISVTAGVALTTVELAYGGRPFELPPRDGVRRLRYRATDALWHKENLIALAERQLDYEYCAAIDGDILFHDPLWAERTVHALQLHPVVQVSSWLVNLGPPPAEEAARVAPSFMCVYRRDFAYWRTEWHDNGAPAALSRHGYPGGAWAWKRRAWHEMGGLPERCILGSGDYHMAFGLVDLPGDPVLANRDYSEGYRRYIADWRAQAFAAIRGDVGLVPGTALHLWHGRTEDRGYETRPRILVRNRYDPHFDVRARPDGLLELAPRALADKPLLRRDLVAYFASRNEDSIDTEDLDAERRRHHPPHRHRHPHPPPPCYPGPG
jgi:hypothetical protein